MTTKEEIVIKREAAMEGLKSQLRQLALDQIKEYVVAGKLITMDHGKQRVEMMKHEITVKGNIDGTKMVIRATNNYLADLDKEEASLKGK